MYLNSLRLLNFKNYTETGLTLAPEINSFVGLNGSGKTNLLDAIHCLCMTKSAFNRSDADVVRHGQWFFMVEGIFKTPQGNNEIKIAFKNNEKKTVLHNGLPYQRLTEHIGRYPVVLIEPDDNNLITGSPELRRRFFNGVMVQLMPQLLTPLVTFGKLTEQRNRALKLFAQTKRPDHALLDAYDQKLSPINQQITQARQEYLHALAPYFLTEYARLTGKAEQPQINYQPSLPNHATPEAVFELNRTHDIAACRTLHGCHRDDFIFIQNQTPLKTHGSQGQKKSFVVALKLAVNALLTEKTHKKPLLLLDDIFDRLDDERITRLMDLITARYFGQVFITDARPERTKNFLSGISAEKSVFSISDGLAKPISFNNL